MMAKKRQSIREVPFAPPPGVPAGVEVLPLADLRARVGQRWRTGPQRPTFHHLLAVTEGVLRHTVDFTAHTLHPGTWLWVRPGQVQQWGELGTAEGMLVLFRPDFLDRPTTAAAHLDNPHAPPVHTPLAADTASLHLALSHLAHEFQSLGRLPLEVHTAALRHLLSVLVLRLAHLSAQAGTAAAEPDETYLRFRDAVEAHFRTTHRVADYAALLGYSTRTLSRATLAAAGVGAKEFVDRRVVLEAKRLLAHSDRTASQIADQLAFPSATHFSKYFHQRVGQTPIGFRTAVRGSAGQSGAGEGGPEQVDHLVGEALRQ
ncbi:AraC-like DNA-binding protein [Crossiella equi]|uniref:AraC-like DNA-binding protein n=1 Tax=Crossiella equi TaxID=130796 RepID=A0ABS5A6Z0_9PSEU|nr:AraC family transcriptional regulator [Crossiella equi]MBP2471984.1 AraC-like DNA-binding protein [Crossiella equi]